MKIYNRPICKCGQPALCLNSGIWLCGNCLIKLDEKLKQLKQKLLMEIQE